MKRLPQVVVNPPGLIDNKKIVNRRPKNIPFKIKMLLPQSKVVEVKKMAKQCEK